MVTNYVFFFLLMWWLLAKVKSVVETPRQKTFLHLLFLLVLDPLEPSNILYRATDIFICQKKNICSHRLWICLTSALWNLFIFTFQNSVLLLTFFNLLEFCFVFLTFYTDFTLSICGTVVSSRHDVGRICKTYHLTHRSDSVMTQFCI